MSGKMNWGRVNGENLMAARGAEQISPDGGASAGRSPAWCGAVFR